MLRRVDLVRTDISEELSASFIRMTRIFVPSSQILVTLMKEAMSSSETSVLTRATWRNIPEDTILDTLHVLSQDVFTCRMSSLHLNASFEKSSRAKKKTIY
jgi:hypothetical protein